MEEIKSNDFYFLSNPKWAYYDETSKCYVLNECATKEAYLSYLEYSKNTNDRLLKNIKLYIKNDALNHNFRFVLAQLEWFDIAKKEIKKGKKESHWMWYIFPQVPLGKSLASKEYAIFFIEAVWGYWSIDYLRNNLLDITSELLKHKGKDIETIMNSDIDCLKLRSCMTLFYIATKEKIFFDVIKTFFRGRFCEKTIKYLEDNKDI